jgi:D-alanine-D-alanine ligase
MAVQRRKPFLGNDAFVETYIDGREFNVALLAGESGPDVLPPAEIRFDAFPEDTLKIVDYRAKWEADSFEYQQTPRQFTFPKEDAPLLGDLRRIALQCWQLFGLRGYARVDFRVDHHQQPWVLEVNANPCLSPDAGFVAAATQAGLSVNDIVARIFDDICV